MSSSSTSSRSSSSSSARASVALEGKPASGSAAKSGPAGDDRKGKLAAIERAIRCVDHADAVHGGRAVLTP